MDRALVIYESWFGSTRKVAQCVADGYGLSGSHVRCVRVDQSTPEDLEGVDLVILGAPTHVHGLSSPATRAEALKWADDPSKELSLETGLSSTGMREWLDAAPDDDRFFAAFSTRADLAELLTGSAARSISRRLRRKGWREFDPTESFTVPRVGDVTEDELRRAELWGCGLSSGVPTVAAGAPR